VSLVSSKESTKVFIQGLELSATSSPREKPDRVLGWPTVPAPIPGLRTEAAAAMAAAPATVDDPVVVDVVVLLLQARE
jgi:hypothetical protein